MLVECDAGRIPEVLRRLREAPCREAEHAPQLLVIVRVKGALRDHLQLKISWSIVKSQFCKS